MKRRVVITGVGVVSPIGSGDAFWENVKKGTCGISPIESFDTTEFSVKLAAEVKDFDPTLYMDKKESKRQDRYSQFALAAADIAVKNSGLDIEKVDSDRFGVIVGSAVGGIHTIEAEHAKLLEKGPGKVSTFFIPMMLSNIASGLVAIKYQAKSVNFSTVTACATGANAIGESYKRIQDGICDVMIAGGSEAAITPCSIAGFSALTTLSTTTDVNRASIPFDKERHGFVMGEGAGIMVLEDYDHAVKRGAKIYAELVGYGATCDAYHMTSPDPSSEGASKAMKNAIEDAGITPVDIGYINAHGTSTLYNDKFETQAIKNIFKENAKNVPISSTKSMTGHLLGAAGAVEAIVCAKSLENGYIPATINHQVTDPELDLNFVPNTGIEKEYDYALSNAFGFGGHNATLVLKKYKGN
ncbi:3-oxoacyl-[acyl-carrier-protein] synthase 2 [bioreactor metagenome]|jgi:3-oxoacyl-[acyl-carrier-protein] synthase II|uniref:3-oxoacyl-[acyl-carrier-protein] synthase 2 n=2 Tax=root TaxID=1 RepID=A0A562J444_9FIRM|nr:MULTISPECIES: beta-ketoacyl-ACP synthase II [Sedimentibacter]MEA5094897.1 beta-ketoacyl-ACP synthase II [Sedimentibacter saalensis]TWH77958.1 3-oxoacyl-[acyl-carrier-protein] synthase II [Sedimentibacter saalensis]